MARIPVCRTPDATAAPDARPAARVDRRGRMSKSAVALSPVDAAACCSPLVKSALSTEEAESIAPLLTALWRTRPPASALPVAPQDDGEACMCDLNDAFDLSQPTISHHLKVLHEAGLLDRTKRGVWVYYKIKPKALANISALLGGVTA